MLNNYDAGFYQRVACALIMILILQQQNVARAVWVAVGDRQTDRQTHRQAQKTIP